MFCSVSQPYVQKEPPTVRVVEGPLFSEVVTYYQHFQQTVRIHNVPGTGTHTRTCTRSSCIHAHTSLFSCGVFVFCFFFLTCAYCVHQVLMVCLWTSPLWWTSGTKIIKSCPCVWSQTSRVRTHSTQTSTVSRLAFIQSSIVPLFTTHLPSIVLSFCNSIIHSHLNNSSNGFFHLANIFWLITPNTLIN